MATRIRLRTFFLCIVVLALAAAGIAALVVRLGIYNIAATLQHTEPVYRLLQYAMRRSVAARVGQAMPPADLDERVRALAGASVYRAHCAQCHGAPGIAPDRLAYGLSPAPANLVPVGREWKPGELFWVVKNGIRMTGMPAWTPHLDDETIWNVVAFLRLMPRLTPEAYGQLVVTLPEAAATARPSQPTSKSPPEAAAAAVRAQAPSAASIRAGRAAISQNLCATCHHIPGFVSATETVGPSLQGMALRRTIAGVIPNTPANMVRFLRDPQSVAPGTAMPDLGLSEQQARDIASHLGTLDRLPTR